MQLFKWPGAMPAAYLGSVSGTVPNGLSEQFGQDTFDSLQKRKASCRQTPIFLTAILICMFTQLYPD